VKTKIYLWYLAEFLLRMKNVSDKSFREGGTHILSLEQNPRFIFRTKTHPQLHILCSINFSPKVAPFVTQRGKISTVGKNTDDDIVRGTRFACWITKLQTHTLRICNTSCFSTATTASQMRLNITMIYKLLVLFNNKSYHGQLLSDFLSVGLYSIELKS